MVQGWGRTGVLAAVMLAGLLAGCTPEPSPSAPVVEPIAHVVVHDGTATVSDSQRASARAVDGHVLSPGDVIVTDDRADTMIDVAWSDGAITRLGPGTAFTVGAPAELLGDRGTQQGGITWNRVPHAEDDYVIELAGQGRASDHGEVFVEDCTRTPCRSAATGGIGADQSRVSIRTNGSTALVDDARLASWHDLTATEWLQRSAQVDEAAGLTPLGDLYQDASPSRAILDGSYDVTRTRTSWSCTGVPCSSAAPRPSDDDIHLTYVIHSECTVSACAVTMSTQIVDVLTRAVSDATVDVISSAASLHWTVDKSLPICRWTYGNGTTEDVGRFRNVVDWQAEPRRAEMRDGAFVVTELHGSSTGSDAITAAVDRGRFPGCEAYEIEFSTSYDMVMTRKDP